MVTMTASLPNPPSLIEYKNYKFLIFNAPSDANLDVYIKYFLENKISHIVRACDPCYGTEKLIANSMTVHEMSFPDGGSPPANIVNAWLSLCHTVFKENKGQDMAIGVHCVAGLGRAPVLVAIALLELGLKYDEAVELIRKKRKGAINAPQLKFLKAYKPKKAKCVIM